MSPARMNCLFLLPPTLILLPSSSTANYLTSLLEPTISDLTDVHFFRVNLKSKPYILAIKRIQDHIHMIQSRTADINMSPLPIDSKTVSHRVNCLLLPHYALILTQVYDCTVTGDHVQY